MTPWAVHPRELSVDDEARAPGDGGADRQIALAAVARQQRFAARMIQEPVHRWQFAQKVHRLFRHEEMRFAQAAGDFNLVRFTVDRWIFVIALTLIRYSTTVGSPLWNINLTQEDLFRYLLPRISTSQKQRESACKKVIGANYGAEC